MSQHRSGIISLENFTVPKVRVSPVIVKRQPNVQYGRVAPRTYIGKPITNESDLHAKKSPDSDAEIGQVKLSPQSFLEPHMIPLRRKINYDKIDSISTCAASPKPRVNFSNSEMDKIIRAKRQNLQAISNFYVLSPISSKRSPPKVITQTPKLVCEPRIHDVHEPTYGAYEQTDLLQDHKDVTHVRKEISFPRLVATKPDKAITAILIEGKQVIKVLGQGSFSTIYLARCCTSGQMQALKLFKNRSEDIDNEFAILMALNHPNIIKAYGIANEKLLKKRVLVLEFANGRTLREIQTLNNPQIFSEAITINMFRQILEGVAYMHDQGVAHCDLKMENIILSAELNIIKIIDFGFARREEHLSESTFCGSMGYMSPQLLRKVKHCMFKSDVWALGIILFKMLFNFFPFRGKNEIEILMRIERKSMSFPSNIKVSNNMEKFLHYLLIAKEANRPTSQEALVSFNTTFKQ